METIRAQETSLYVLGKKQSSLCFVTEALLWASVRVARLNPLETTPRQTGIFRQDFDVHHVFVLDSVSPGFENLKSRRLGFSSLWDSSGITKPKKKRFSCLSPAGFLGYPPSKPGKSRGGPVVFVVKCFWPQNQNSFLVQKLLVFPRCVLFVRGFAPSRFSTGFCFFSFVGFNALFILVLVDTFGLLNRMCANANSFRNS